MSKRSWVADRKIPGLGVMVLPSGVRTYYLRYREPTGKQQTHRIGRADVIGPEIARQEAHKILADVARGQSPTSARKLLRNGPSMADLFARVDRDYYRRKLRPRSRRNYRDLWRLHILPAIGTRKVALISTGEVAALVADLPDATGRRVRAVLSKAFNLAELWGLRPQQSNPCRLVPTAPERQRRRYLSRAELDQLLAALDGYGATAVQWRFAQLIRLLLLTGCRLREIMHARWEWLDGITLRIPAEAHKTGGRGDDRVIHLAPEAMAVLEQLRRSSSSEWIIAGRGTGPLSTYWGMWRQLLGRAGISNLRVHDLRHSYASHAIAAGLTLTQVGQLLGHRKATTTGRYVHLIDEAAAAAAAKVAAQIKTPVG